MALVGTKGIIDWLLIFWEEIELKVGVGIFRGCFKNRRSGVAGGDKSGIGVGPRSQGSVSGSGAISRGSGARASGERVGFGVVFGIGSAPGPNPSSKFRDSLKNCTECLFGAYFYDSGTKCGSKFEEKNLKNSKIFSRDSYWDRLRSEKKLEKSDIYGQQFPILVGTTRKTLFSGKKKTKKLRNML